jgi:hypothetical protein
LGDRWFAEKYQREKLFDALDDIKENDLILFSDSDEIPNPKKLNKFNVRKKISQFFYKNFTRRQNSIYLIRHETPWEGTRAV